MAGMYGETLAQVFSRDFVHLYQSVKLHYAVTFEMLHRIVTFESVIYTPCCNIVLLQDVAL